MYDLSESQLPSIPTAKDIPLWTSRESIRRVFRGILDYWRHKPERREKFESKEIQTTVTLAWKSHSDAFDWCPNDNALKEMLAQEQNRAFHILDERRFHPRLFELCIHHRYFNGLLRIGREHRLQKDKAQYDLIPLLTKLQDKSNIDGHLFPEFALRWFADRDLFGQVFIYGKHCPANTLALVINTTPKLEKYRWIHSVRQGNYGEAATSLLDANIKNQKKLSVGDAKIQLSVASIINRVAEKESYSSRFAALNTRRTIDKKKELVAIQLASFGENASENDRLMQPQKLFNKLLDKLLSLEHNRASADEKAELLFQASK